MQDLSDDGHITLLFEAWKFDYTKDPLNCLLSTLYQQMETAVNDKIPRENLDWLKKNSNSCKRNEEYY